MDVASAILACSLYFDDDLVHAVVESSSRGNAYYVHDIAGVGSDAETQPRAIDDAMVRAGDMRVNGGRLILGLMSLPVDWVNSFGRPLRDAFDPCVNISIGTAMLSRFAYECRRQPRLGPHGLYSATDTQVCVAKKYAGAIGMPEFEEVIALNIFFRQGQPRVVADGADAPVFMWRAEQPWGPGRILVPIGRR